MCIMLSITVKLSQLAIQQEAEITRLGYASETVVALCLQLAVFVLVYFSSFSVILFYFSYHSLFFFQ